MALTGFGLPSDASNCPNSPQPRLGLSGSSRETAETRKSRSSSLALCPPHLIQKAEAVLQRCRDLNLSQSYMRRERYGSRTARRAVPEWSPIGWWSCLEQMDGLRRVGLARCADRTPSIEGRWRRLDRQDAAQKVGRRDAADRRGETEVPECGLSASADQGCGRQLVKHVELAQ